MDNNLSRFEKIFGSVGAGVGIIIGVVADAPLWGACLAAVLVFIGFFIGKKIDQIRAGERTTKTILKQLLVVLVILVASFGLFKMCTYKAPDRLVACSNCGTMMAPQSIKPYGCTRCDGRDWS